MHRLLFSLILALSLPAFGLEKTWYTSPNNTLDSTSITTSSQNQLWQIYAALTGVASAWTNNTQGGTAPSTGLWTVRCSSNGTTAPSDNCATDHTDRWTSTYSAANFVRNAAGAHSYMVLQSPGLSSYPTIYLIIDWNTASDQTANFSVSKTAPTCAGNCTTTTAPTATDVFAINTAAFTFNPNSIASQNRLHYSVSADGDFWVLPSRDGSGWVSTTLLAVWFLKDYKTADVIPVMGCGGQTVTAVISGVSWVNASNSNQLCAARNGANSATVAAIPQMTGAGNTNVLANVTPMLSGNLSVTFTGSDALDGKYDDLPIYVGSTAGTGISPVTNALRGRLPDTRWAPITLAEGATGPLTAPFSIVKYQAIWLPWVCTSGPTL